jgi:two-component system response regulator YesN
MLKVVIADDEARVCRLVRMLADWDALGMIVAGTASNGFEALELIKTLEPDILITDIRMPGCNGLELIEKARAISPRLEIALISGYAQFEYAQTAMRFDVGGYILKPIKKEILTATLEKLGGKCRERAASATAIENLRRTSRKSHELLRNRLPEDLLSGRLGSGSPTRARLADEYDFKIEDGPLRVFVIKTDCDPDIFKDMPMAAIRDKIEEIFEEAVSSLCHASACGFIGSAFYGVLNYEEGHGEKLRRVLRRCLNQLEAQKFIFGSVEFSLSLGKAVYSPEELQESMSDARCAITERLVEGTGRLLEKTPAASHADLRKLLDKYNRAIDHIVETLSEEDAAAAISELKAEIDSVPDIRGHEIWELILAAGKMFALRLHMGEETEATREFEERCGLCSSADKLFGYLWSFQRRQLSIASERRKSENIRPIRVAKQYMNRHFGEQISLDDICGATGFSASYFSTMFKKETGEGVLKYLTRVRIEKSKSLLQDTALSVEEICNQVGYSDLKHFTITFKKATSLNPAQYRRLYG